MTPSPWTVLSALLLVQILFGINYVTSKVIVQAFQPLVWSSLRMIFSAVFLLSLAKAMGRPFPKGGKKFFIPLILFSLLGVVINQSSFLMGLRYTTATNSAILNTLTPLITLLIVTVRGIEPLTRLRAVGFTCAFLGVALVRKIWMLDLSDSTLIGDVLTLVNCISFSFYLVYGKNFISQHDRVWTTAWLFTYGSVGLSIVAIPDFMNVQWPVMTPELIFCMVFAIFGATIGTYFLNNWALAYADPSHVALLIYVQPAVTALLAYVWKGETVTPLTVGGCLLIFTGVFFALKKPRPVPSPRQL